MSDTPKSFYEQELDRLYDEESQLRPEHYVQVRQSRAFMEQHHANKIELDELAAAAFMSRFHYVRMFQKMYGVTPRHYLRDLRIEKAKSLLSEGMPITQVCFEVGYESLPTFSSVFKKCTGLSPKQFQKRQLSNQE